MSSAAAPDHLRREQAEVEARREQLGEDLDALVEQTRQQVGVTVEKIIWKLAAAGAGAAAAIATNAALKAAWKGLRKTDPPDDPTAPGVGWGDALIWTAATAVAVGVAKLVVMRGAAAGWQRATGTLPPGLAERR